MVNEITKYRLLKSVTRQEDGKLNGRIAVIYLRFEEHIEKLSGNHSCMKPARHKIPQRYSEN